MKTAAMPHVVARAAVKHTAASTQASTTNQAIVARMNAGKKLPSRGVWKAPNYADSLEGDNVDGEDLVARRAAVDALGPLNGSIVVTDANTGRVLTIVNQKLAFKSGYQPCSTVKVPGGAGRPQRKCRRPRNSFQAHPPQIDRHDRGDCPFE